MLHVQLGLPCAFDHSLPRFQRGFDPVLHKLIHLFRRAPNVVPCIKQFLQLQFVLCKVRVFVDPCDKVIWLAFLLHHARRLLRKDLSSNHQHSCGSCGGCTVRLTLIRSCASCLSPPFLTTAMMTFSVAMNGSSSTIRLAMTCG